MSVDTREGEVNTVVQELREAHRRGDDPLSIAVSQRPSVRALATIALFNSGEHDLAAATVPDDHLHDMRATGIPGMGVFRGRTGFRRFLAEWTDAFPDAHLTPELTFEVDDPEPAAFGVVTQRVRGGGSGVPVEFRYAWILDEQGSTFGTDLEAMRAEFRSRYGADPGPT